MYKCIYFIDNVLHFLTRLSASLKPFATRDYELMRSIKASLTTSTSQVCLSSFILQNLCILVLYSNSYPYVHSKTVTCV